MAGDRRTKYTKSVIREALFELLREKPLSRVTVTDICKLADINRSTFYSYYEDVNSLMNTIQTEVFENILDSLNTDDWFDELLHLVDENRDLFSILIGPHGDSQFIRQLIYLGYDNSMRLWAEMYPDATPAEMDYAYAYISYGVIGILENWVCDNYKEDINEVGNLLYGFTMNGLDYMKRDHTKDDGSHRPAHAPIASPAGVKSDSSSKTL